MTPRRVAYVVGTFPKISETFIIGELAELRRRGIDVRILSLKRPEEAIYHDSVRDAGLLERTIYDAACFDDVLDEFQPDLVHAHFATDPAATARSIAGGRGLPFTFTAHGYDVYRRPPADFADRASAAASVVTVSDANRRYLSERFGVAAARVHVIPCGIDTDWFRPGQPDREPPLVVCVARLREVKQLDLLIRACALVRDRGTAFRCVIVGEGPERAKLEELRAAVALDGLVDMPGAAEQRQVRAWWRRASVAVLSSRSEGMPVSLMEAAACGVPAVAPGVGGIPELISHDETGFVTPTGDCEVMAAALNELLVNAPLRLRMRAAARARAEQRFARTRQIDRLLAVWSSVLN
jgi:colanic acid/amylovoran biosynthesis glycosyltransferase